MCPPSHKSMADIVTTASASPLARRPAETVLVQRELDKDPTKIRDSSGV